MSRRRPVATAPDARNGSTRPADPTTTDSHATALRQRLAAAGDSLGLTLDPQTGDRLLGYLDLLRRWNRAFNLTSLRDPEAMWTGHLLDCLAIVPALRRHAAGRRLRVLDAGSGGGLPGVVLAMIEPDWRVVCVDAAAKKASFIRQVALEFGVANLESLHARVESLPATAAPFDLVISRAFASLQAFTAMTERALASDGVWVAMKARPDAAEFSRLPPAVDLFHVEHLRVPGVEVDRCLVWMRRSAADERRYSSHGEDPLHR